MPSSTESSTTTKRVRLTYCIGTPAGSSGGRKGHRGINVSRTWVNKSLNKSRVVTRSLRTNNRTLAKKLNAVQMELTKAEEQLTSLRDAHESLQQDNRLKEGCLADVFAQVGEMTQGLVLLAKRIEEGLGGVSHVAASPLPLHPMVLSDADVVDPKLEIIENPFMPRDRIPRTPPFAGVAGGDTERCQAMTIIAESPPKPKHPESRRGNADVLVEKMLNELMSQAGAVDEDADATFLSSPAVSPEWVAWKAQEAMPAGQRRMASRVGVSPTKPLRSATKPRPQSPQVRGRPRRVRPVEGGMEDLTDSVEPRDEEPTLRRKEEGRQMDAEPAPEPQQSAATEEQAPPAALKTKKERRRKSAVELLSQMWPGVDHTMGRRRSSAEFLDLHFPPARPAAPRDGEGRKVMSVKRGRPKRPVEASPAPAEVGEAENPRKVSVKKGKPRRPPEDPSPELEAAKEDEGSQQMAAGKSAAPLESSAGPPPESQPPDSAVRTGGSPRKPGNPGRPRKSDVLPPPDSVTPTEGPRKPGNPGRPRKSLVQPPPDSVTPIAGGSPRKAVPGKPRRPRKSAADLPPGFQPQPDSVAPTAGGSPRKAVPGKPGRPRKSDVLPQPEVVPTTSGSPRKAVPGKPGRPRKSAADLPPGFLLPTGGGSPRDVAMVKRGRPRKSAGEVNAEEPRRSSSEPAVTGHGRELQPRKLVAGLKGKSVRAAVPAKPKSAVRREAGGPSSPKRMKAQPPGLPPGPPLSPVAARGRPRLSAGSPSKSAGRGPGSGVKGKVRRSRSSPPQPSPVARTVRVAAKRPGVLVFSAQRQGVEEKPGKGARGKLKKARGRPAKAEKDGKEAAVGDAVAKPAAPKTVFDFSLSDTMNKTVKLPPTLSEFREKNEQAPVGREAAGVETQAADVLDGAGKPQKKPRGRQPKEKARPLHERQAVEVTPGPLPAPSLALATPGEDDFQTKRPGSGKRRYRRLVTFDDSVDDGEDSRPADKRPRVAEQTETPPTDEDPSDVENKGSRARRGKPKNYKEPNIHSKVRRGDPTWCRS